MSANNDGNSDDPFDFGVPETEGYLEWIHSALVDRLSNAMVWDAGVWTGRILVTLAIVVVWDAYHANADAVTVPPPNPSMPQQTQQHRQNDHNQQREERNLPTSKEASRDNSSDSCCSNNSVRSEISPPEPPLSSKPENTNTNTKSVFESKSESKPVHIEKKEENREPTSSSPADPPAGEESNSSDVSDDKMKNKKLVSSLPPTPKPTPTPLASKAPSSETSETPSSSAATAKTNTSANSNSKAVTPKPTTATANVITAPGIGSDEHPGMEGFLHWYEVETSLYRIYTLAHKDPSIPTVPPYAPNSHRGRVSIELNVTNRTHRDINVFWVDYKGKLVPKGRIPKHRGVWTQTTWIDHPWVFEDALTATPYLYYVPYRVIPTIPEAPTMGSDGTTGVHKFALVDNADASNRDTASNGNRNGNGNGNRNGNSNIIRNSPFHIGIADDVLPFPGLHRLDQPLKAIHWTLLHLSRADASASHNGWIGAEADTLQKYLVNILRTPEEYKYRNLRIAARRFQSIWASPLRGLLLAVGFVEDGGSCTLGRSDRPLASGRIQEVALLSYLLSEWKRKNENAISSGSGSGTAGTEGQQPRGASDGFGRAGFGRAGANH